MRRLIKIVWAVLLLVSVVRLETPRTLAAETMVRVAVDPSLPPYQFVRDGKCVGAHIDILNQISDNSNLLVDYQPMANMTECMKALEEGKVDMVLGAILPAHGGSVSYYTQAISQSSICMVVENGNVDEVLNQKSSVSATYQNGTISMSFIKNIKNLRYIPVSSQERAFGLLMKGDVDAMVGVRSSLLYQLEHMKLTDRYTIISNYMLPIEFSIKVREGDRELLKKLNDSLYRLRISGDYETIHSRWVEDDANRYKAMIHRAVQLALAAAVVVLAVFLFNLRLNYLLKLQVAEQTQTIRQANLSLQQQIIETQESNQVRNYIVESNPSAIIVFDRALRITLLNDSARSLFRDAGLEVGQSIRHLPLIGEMLQLEPENIFTPSAQFQNLEIVSKSNEEKDASYRVSMYLLNSPSEGEPARGAILTIQDITRENQIKEQEFERQKNLALNRMVASVAHEIRNPLMSIKTYAELIPLKRSSAAFQDQMAQYLPREVDRINGLVSSLIDYAKPRSKTKELISVAEVVESCVLLTRPMLKDKTIDVVTELQDDPQILINRNHLKQVLINILLNGVEAMEAKRAETGSDDPMELSIRAWEEAGRCFIEVSDEGIGMSEEQVLRATDPFFTTKANGTGLGLSLCKQFVEENSGHLRIWSKEGFGTKIVLVFERNEP